MMSDHFVVLVFSILAAAVFVAHCQEITCPPVPPSEHLHISSSDNYVGAAVNFSCDPGYTVSQRFITCGPTGFWSYSPIICKAVICHPFAYADDLDEYLISNERPGRFPVGYVFTYSCVENYHLVGPSNVTCLINGSLSARHRPQCERDPQCPSVSVDHGNFTYLDTDLPLLGTEGVVACHEGYGPIYRVTTLRCDEDYIWQPYTPTCERLCPTLNLDSNLRHSPLWRFHGAAVNLSCGSNYILSGSSLLRCGYGEWNAAPPTCSLRGCPPLTLSGHLVSSSSSLSVGSVVSFDCEVGWHLYGPAVIVCQLGGSWNASFPICIFEGFTTEQPLTETSSIQNHVTSSGGPAVPVGAIVGGVLGFLFLSLVSTALVVALLILKIHFKGSTYGRLNVTADGDDPQPLENITADSKHL